MNMHFAWQLLTPGQDLQFNYCLVPKVKKLEENIRRAKHYINQLILPLVTIWIGILINLFYHLLQSRLEYAFAILTPARGEIRTKKTQNVKTTFLNYSNNNSTRKINAMA